MEERTKRYNRLFSGKVSTYTFLMIYTLYLLSIKGERLTGKDIYRRIEERFPGSWNPSHGMIYPLLRELEQEGLVKGKWDDPTKKTRRVYWITITGHKVFELEKQKNEHLFQEALNVITTFLSDLYGQSFCR